MCACCNVHASENTYRGVTAYEGVHVNVGKDSYSITTPTLTFHTSNLSIISSNVCSGGCCRDSKIP